MTVEELLKRGDDLREAAASESDPNLKYRKFGQSAHFYKVAANRGSGEGSFRMGMAYYRNEGAPGLNRSKPEPALEIFERTANEMGHAEAAEWAGRLLLTERVWDSYLGWRPRFNNNIPRAAKYLYMAIERGSITAKEPLAQMHADGNGVAWDLGKALELRMEVVKAGKLSPEGWCRLGEMHRDGFGTPKNRQEAAKCFQTAMEAGNLLGGTRLGQLQLTHETPPNIAAAIPFFERAKEGSEPEGMTELAMLMANGDGVEKNTAAAFEMLEKAAKLGYGGAMHASGILHVKGIGTKKDVAAAVRWFKRGADIGNSDSMVRLGQMHLVGKDVELDNFVALEFFGNAARAGNVRAMRLLSNALWAGENCDADPAEAAGWCERAAERGDVPAMNRIGYSYMIGDGVRKDNAAAMRWFRKAADEGSADAIANVGRMFDTGRGTAMDPAEATKWYQRAADEGHSGAMLWIAKSHLEGRDRPKDVKQGIEWLSKCAQEKSAAPAMRELARLLMEGEEIEKDETAGMAWLVKAAEAGDGPAMFILGSAYLDGTRVTKKQETAEEWFNRAFEAGEGRAALTMGVLTSARLTEKDFSSDSLDGLGSGERRLATAARWFRRAANLGYPIPNEYVGVVKAEAAIQKARSDRAEARESEFMMRIANLPQDRSLPRSGGEWENLLSQGASRRAADAAYDAMAAQRDFRSQTAGYFGSQGLQWREGDR